MNIYKPKIHFMSKVHMDEEKRDKYFFGDVLCHNTKSYGVSWVWTKVTCAKYLAKQPKRKTS